MATKNSVHLSLEQDNSQLIYPNGAVFNITQRGCLYYLKIILFAKNITYDLHTWHYILGHCNESDIKKLPNLVKGMKIKLTPNYALNCDISIQEKMSNDQNKTLQGNKNPCTCTQWFSWSHKDGYKYVLNFIDDYSSLMMLYFLKHKSDILITTTKYLADITPYSHTMELSSLLNLFNSYLYMIRSNMSRQLLIHCIKMEPLSICDEPYYPWQGVTLLSQNCPKTYGFTYWWCQRILEIVVIIETQQKPHMKVSLVQNQIR